MVYRFLSIFFLLFQISTSLTTEKKYEGKNHKGIQKRKQKMMKFRIFQFSSLEKHLKEKKNVIKFNFQMTFHALRENKREEKP